MMKHSKSEKGFSMVELIIVIAIMGIIGAVLVPYYFSASDKARITTDVSSVITIQKQVEIYQVEFGRMPGTSAEDIVKELVDMEYLNQGGIEADGKMKLQTPNAEVVYDATAMELRIKVEEQYYDLCEDNKNLQKWLIKAP